MALSSGNSLRMRSTLAHSSGPACALIVTSTLVLAARRISAICAGSSSGLTGLAMPADCAPNSDMKLSGNSGSGQELQGRRTGVARGAQLQGLVGALRGDALVVGRGLEGPQQRIGAQVG